MYRRINFFQRTAAMSALAVGLTGAASAGLMNFETAVPGSFLTTSSDFDQDGIQLSLVHGHYDLWNCSSSLLCPPSNGIVAGLDSVQTGPATVRIALITGTFFNLDSLLLLTSDPSSFMEASNGSLLFFGSSGGTLTEPSGFQGIHFFEISSSVEIAGGFLFDNIGVSTVPEPSTVVLLLLPFVTAAGLRERPHRRG